MDAFTPLKCRIALDWSKLGEALIYYYNINAHLNILGLPNYTLSQGTWVAVVLLNEASKSNDSNIDVLGISIKLAIIISIIFVIIANLDGTSTLSSIWDIVGQLQLFYFILLTKAYFPDKVPKIIIHRPYEWPTLKKLIRGLDQVYYEKKKVIKKIIVKN